MDFDCAVQNTSFYVPDNYHNDHNESVEQMLKQRSGNSSNGRIRSHCRNKRAYGMYSFPEMSYLQSSISKMGLKRVEWSNMGQFQASLQECTQNIIPNRGSYT